MSVPVVGVAQELITNKVAYGVPRPDDTSWTPQTPPAAVFYAQQGMIYDWKSVPGDSNFINWPDQSVFFTRTQNLRMVFTDPCGNQRIYSLGAASLANFKIDFSTWQVQKQ